MSISCTSNLNEYNIPRHGGMQPSPSIETLSGL